MDYLVFTLNNVKYAIDVNIVESVFDYKGSPLRSCSFPSTVGEIELNGQMVPIIDLNRKLGLPQTDKTKARRIIVFTFETEMGNTYTLGTIVDWVHEVATIEDYQFRESLQNERCNLEEQNIKGITNIEGSLVNIIDADKLFTPEEIEALSLAS
jgi:purine-binding chemotaxis protein CheW